MLTCWCPAWSPAAGTGTAAPGRGSLRIASLTATLYTQASRQGWPAIRFHRTCAFASASTAASSALARSPVIRCATATVFAKTPRKNESKSSAESRLLVSITSTSLMVAGSVDTSAAMSHSTKPAGKPAEEVPGCRRVPRSAGTCPSRQARRHSGSRAMLLTSPRAVPPTLRPSAARQLLQPAAAPEQRQVPAVFGLRQRNATQYLAERDTNP